MNLNGFLNLTQTLKNLWPLTKKLTGKGTRNEATPSTSETAAALSDPEIGERLQTPSTAILQSQKSNRRS